MIQKAKIANEIQYEWVVKRVEELLPLVDDNTPLDAHVASSWNFFRISMPILF